MVASKSTIQYLLVNQTLLSLKEQKATSVIAALAKMFQNIGRSKHYFALHVVCVRLQTLRESIR